MTEQQLYDLRCALDHLASAIQRCAFELGFEMAISDSLDSYRQSMDFIVATPMSN